MGRFTRTTWRESLAAEDPKDVHVLRELVTSYIRLSDLLWHVGDSPRALDNARKEIPFADKLSHADPSNPQNRLLLAMCHVDQGYKEAMLGGDRAAGLEDLRTGTAMIEQMLTENPADMSMRRRLVLGYGRVAEIQRLDSKNNAESLASFRKAVAILQPTLAADPNNAEVRRLMAYYEYSIGQLLGDMNQVPAALDQEREALASFEKLAAADPTNVQLQQDIGRVRESMGLLLLDGGDANRAIGELQKSIEILDKMADAKDPRSLVGYSVATDQFLLGKAHTALAFSGKLSTTQEAEHCRQAQSWFRFCVPKLESLRDAGSQFPDAAEMLTEARQEMSRCSAQR